MSDYRMVHKLIKKTAMEMAEHSYEFFATDNTFYKHFPDSRTFARKNWRRFVRVAKQVLTSMLTGNYPQSYKDEIYEALLDDATLPYSQQETQIVNIPH